MIIILIVYSLIILYIIGKSFYISKNPLYNVQNRKHFQDSISFIALPFYLNQGKINLFAFFINFLILIFINISLLPDLFFNNSTNTAFCAGVSKLVNELNIEFNQKRSIFSNTELDHYKSNNFMKNLLKYNFEFLDRKNNFFSDRKCITEIENICIELNFIYNYNIEVFIEILTSFQLDKNLTKINRDIILLLEENIFKLKNLELCNKKLGVPLYNSLYNITLIGENGLPSLLEPRISDKDLVLNKISPFLSKSILTKNINYFNTELSIILSKNKLDSLMILEPSKTVEATSKIKPSLIFDGYTVKTQKMVGNKVFSEILINQTGELIEVVDLEVRNEAPNGKTPNILKGGFGIIEAYVYYTECMLKTKTLLEYTNKQISHIETSSNQQKDIMLILENFKKKNLKSDFFEFKKSRIIKKSIVFDSNYLFENSQNIPNKNISLKFEKINNIFLKQLNSDVRMLKDIHEQQSGMVVNYQKLIQVMNDSNNSKTAKYFTDEKVKNQILEASKGKFSNKRYRR